MPYFVTALCIMVLKLNEGVRAYLPLGRELWIRGFFLIISFMASVLGAICGIGGGVLMKPILDSLGLMEVSTVSFLSGCTVLSMSFYAYIIF